MKKKLLAFALAALAAAPVLAGPNVGVSIGIHQPGVYGRIDIGGYPQPALVYPEPVVITQPRVVVERRPIYLYVPPAHQTHWRQYCGRYDACGQPVYFVQDRWVRERWEERRAHDGDRGQRPEHHDNGRHLGHDKHDKHDRSEGHDGHGKHGEGRGRGH